MPFRGKVIRKRQAVQQDVVVYVCGTYDKRGHRTVSDEDNYHATLLREKL